MVKSVTSFDWNGQAKYAVFQEKKLITKSGTILTENTSLFPNKSNAKIAERLFLGLQIQVFSANPLQKAFLSHFFSRPHYKSFLSAPLLWLAASLSHTKLASHSSLSLYFLQNPWRKTSNRMVWLIVQISVWVMVFCCLPKRHFIFPLSTLNKRWF